jgi:hydrogenase nickel incorporation protein HypA/HybF
LISVEVHPVHEYSLIQALLDRVAREAAARSATKVHRLWLRIGEVSGVEVGLLRTAYEMCRERTICEGAALEVRQDAARWACPRCEAEIPRGERLVCGACGVAARLASGDEIVLDRIEMEVL